LFEWCDNGLTTTNVEIDFVLGMSLDPTVLRKKITKTTKIVTIVAGNDYRRYFHLLIQLVFYFALYFTIF
jgi:hypothetical protein